MKNKVEVSAPGKLMLFGEHSVVYGRPCIVTAVDQRMRAKITLHDGKFTELIAPEVGIKNFKAKITASKDKLPKGATFVFAAVKNFFNEFNVSSGLKIETSSDFSSTFGFGSSSAVTVCVVKGLSEIFGIKLTDKKLFDICYKTVLDVQGVGSGFDIAAAVFGGTLYFIGGGKKITRISQKGLPLIVGYTGIKADTTTLIKKVAELKNKEPKLIESLFDLINLIVENARKALKDRNFKKLGELADINQGVLDALGVSTKEIFNLVTTARSAGAYGAKLSGAGGGDCIIAFADNKSKNNVQKQIIKKGGIVLNVQTGADGVRIEEV